MILISTSVTESKYTQTVKLGDDDYDMLLRWSQRDGRWYLSMWKDDELLIAGRKIVAGFPLLPTGRSDPWPQGVLFAYDTTEVGIDPGLAELGDRVILCFEEDDD